MFPYCKGKDLETLIVASIQTLKRNNKKSVESEERLDALVESHSVNIKLLGTRTCLSLPKLNEDTNSKESSDETLARNDTSAISEKEELIKFKKSILEEFDVLKPFFPEVNLFKNKHLNSFRNDVSINNLERLIKQLQDNIYFLREQLKNKRRNYQLFAATNIKT